MKVTAERIENHQIVLEVQIPEEQVTKAFNQAYHKLANKVNIPGFRKGKTPRKILETRLGIEAFKDEVFEIIVPRAYSEALKEQNIIPVTPLEEGSDFTFKATVIAKPEVTLGEYKGLTIPAVKYEVADEDVEQKLEGMRDRQAKMVVAEGAEIGNGDFAIIDFEGFVDGKPFSGGDAKGYPLQIGSGSFIPGFEDQLIGAKSGEERQIQVSFPTDYFVESLAGKQADFKVAIKDVKRKQLPELNDDFAKELGEFDTLEELKADTRNKLEEAARNRAEKDFRAAVVQKAVENASVDIPDVMVNERVENMISDFEFHLHSRGMNLEQYLKYANQSIEELQKSYREPAYQQVKTDLVMETIAKTEKIEVTEKDVEIEIVTMAAEYKTTAEEVKKIIVEQGRTDALVMAVLRKKAAKIVLDSCIKEE